MITNIQPKPPRYVSTLVLRVTFMSGDADAYETVEWTFKPDDTEGVRLAKKFLYFVSQQNDFYRPGTDWSGPRLPPEFARFDEDWPTDSTTNDGEAAAFDKSEWVYYDAEGRECSCEVQV